MLFINDCCLKTLLSPIKSSKIINTIGGCLYFANVKMVIEKIFEEVSGLLTESQFEEIYKHATEEPYNALVIDNHPKVDRDKRFKKNFNVVLTHGS